MDEKMRILLCEDDENLGMLLREYLQAKGYDTELCPDGEAGYKSFLKNKYDLCVLDVMMPKKDGFTLAQEIRAANSEIPIIFLTAKTFQSNTVHTQHASVQKQAQPAEIQEALSVSISSTRLKW